MSIDALERFLVCELCTLHRSSGSKDVVTPFFEGTTSVDLRKSLSRLSLVIVGLGSRAVFDPVSYHCTSAVSDSICCWLWNMISIWWKVFFRYMTRDSSYYCLEQELLWSSYFLLCWLLVELYCFKSFWKLCMAFESCNFWLDASLFLPLLGVIVLVGLLLVGCCPAEVALMTFFIDSFLRPRVP